MAESIPPTHVGFIGLGDQGGPMAEMLLSDGHAVHVWSRRERVAGAFRARGATAHACAADAAAAVALMCICVTADADVLQVAEEGGVLDAMAAGSILAVHSTVSPAVCLRLQERARPRGVEVVDAPVSGSGIAARERRLLMMLGGDAAATAFVRDVFAGFCNPILHMGPLGSALHAKLINNTLMAANLELARAALSAGEQFGLDRQRLQQALVAGVARSFAMEAIMRLESTQRARHIAPVMRKDLQVSASVAEAAGVRLGPLLPLAEAAQAHLQRCSEQ